MDGPTLLTMTGGTITLYGTFAGGPQILTGSGSFTGTLVNDSVAH